MLTGYTSILSGAGVLVDLTPPYTTLLENATLDEMQHRLCQEFIPDRYKHKCVGQTPLDNYRWVWLHQS